VEEVPVGSFAVGTMSKPKNTRQRRGVRHHNWKKKIFAYHNSKVEQGDDADYYNEFGKNTAEQALEKHVGEEVSPAGLPNLA
jgi:hypothetical protein